MSMNILYGTRVIIKGDLAFVERRIPDTNIYEVTLANDHKPGSGYDPIRAFPFSELRIATPEEVEEKLSEWERQNNYKLPRKKFTS